MWQLVTSLLRVFLLIAAASALFVVGAVFVSSFTGMGPSPDEEGTEAGVEVRLSSQGSSARLFAGQPLVVDVVLLNLGARSQPIASSDGQTRTLAESQRADHEADLQLDGRAPWERRLAIEVTTPDGTTVLENLRWHARLLDPVPASGRRLGRVPSRARFILDASDLAPLPPGPYVISATIPPEVMAPERVRVIPLQVSITAAPTRDADRASVSLANARVAALRNNPKTAIEAAMTALALDPLLDESLMIIAESWEEEGDLDRATEWYGRYLETMPRGHPERAELEGYVRALRDQR